MLFFVVSRHATEITIFTINFKTARFLLFIFNPIVTIGEKDLNLGCYGHTMRCQIVEF